MMIGKATTTLVLALLSAYALLLVVAEITPPPPTAVLWFNQVGVECFEPFSQCASTGTDWVRLHLQGQCYSAVWS